MNILIGMWIVFCMIYGVFKIWYKIMLKKYSGSVEELVTLEILNNLADSILPGILEDEKYFNLGMK